MFGPEAVKKGTPMMGFIAASEGLQEFTKFGCKPSLRSRMDETMLQAPDSGRCKVVLVRGFDFYGPEVTLAALGKFAVPAMIKAGAAGCNHGTSAVLLDNPKLNHTWTYAPGLAKAMVAVADAGEAFWGRAWHVPNAPAVPVADVLDRLWTMGGHAGSAKYTTLRVCAPCSQARGTAHLLLTSTCSMRTIME
ncbi:unnamed protein product [Discosporangium mesarthrocarpum]